MTTNTPTIWQDLFREQRHALLGQQASRHRNAEVRSLADEEILLLGGASEAARLSARPAKAKEEKAPLSVALTPEPNQTIEAFHSHVLEMRQAHPHAELAGFGPLTAPAQERFRHLDRGLVLAGKVGKTFEPASDLSTLDNVTLPITAVLIYSPDTTAEALEQAAKALSEIFTLVGVVPLPAGAGDRIPLPGLTTSGSLDVMVLSVLRLLLPLDVRVRASWAALGWKVAQAGLAYGADELAGWTAAETLAYTGRVRAASRVERQELNEGLEEARCRDLSWPIHAIGGAK